MSDRVLSAAMWWLDRSVGVVPLRPELVPNAKGKLSPVPWVRWQQEGPLRSVEKVRSFWEERPDAQLAILLERGLVTVDVDLKHLPRGKAPEGCPIPQELTWCYTETTKGNGLHYIFRVKEELDPKRSSRVIGLAGYVDVLHGGILVVAPSRFTNAEKGYRLVRSTLPMFGTMTKALTTFAAWLPTEWEAQWAQSQTVVSSRSAPGGVAGSSWPPIREWPVDPDEVERAVAFVQTDRETRRFFTEGYRNRDGSVDHSQTEFRLTALLRARGFSKSASWSVVRGCQHTKSPFDPRGRGYFEAHLWGRLEAQKQS